MAVVSTSTGVPPTEAPVLGQSEHDKAMLAKVDGAAPAGTPPATPAAPAAKPQRPEGVPEKFWDAEKGEVKTADLLKSYSELEKGRSKTPAEPPKAPAATPPAGDPAAAAAEAAKAAGGDASKVDIPGMFAKFAEQGSLGDDDYKALEAAGLPRDLVDGYIAGEQAKATIMVQEAQAAVGGAEQYDAMLTWAAANLTAGERAAFDQNVVGTPEARKLAIEALHGRFTAAVGTNPQLVRANSGAGGEGGYQSRAEVTADMRDPRYKSDPAFRAKVEQKLAASNVF